MPDTLTATGSPIFISGHRPFGNGNHEAQKIILREAAKRGIALADRGCSCRKQGPREGVNLRHDAVERRRHARVIEHGLILAECGLGGEQGLFGGGERRLLRGNIRVRFQVLSPGDVDFLLRDKFRTRFLDVGQARVGKMRDGVRRLRAVQILVRARQFLIAAADGGLILLQLLLQLRDFQYGEELPLPYMSPVIDVEFLDVAGDFCVHVDFLERLEFRCDLQVIRDVPSRHFYDGGRGSVRGSLMSLAAGNESSIKNKEDKETQDAPETPHWMTSTISHDRLNPLNPFSLF
jgi:hypothetical protein